MQEKAHAMTATKLRPDNRPFYQDSRGKIPTYTLEHDDSGRPIIVHQFSGLFACLPPDHTIADIARALESLKERVKEYEE